MEKEEKEKGTSSSRQNVLYSSTCSMCKLKGRKTKYLGELSRSLHERRQEHNEDPWSTREEVKIHMKEHWIEEHEGKET